MLEFIIRMEIKTTIRINSCLYKISSNLNKLFEDKYDNMTNLHRWCNTTSPKYKNTCDWEKKLDNAGRDNCYSKYN